jgi:probable HAF family extracellular repeat protein
MLPAGSPGALVAEEVVMKRANLVASMLAVVLSSAGAQPPQYQVICLDCAYGSPLQPTGINAAGVVVAYSQKHHRGLILHHDFVTPIPTLDGGWHNGVSGINDAGEVVGGSPGIWDDVPSAFGYSWDGVTLTNLGDPIDSYYRENYWSTAIAVNNAGQVVGNAAYQFQEKVAFIYSAGTMKAIIYPGALDDTHANGVNSHGRVAGGAVDTDYFRHAWTWRAGKLTDLSVGFEYSEAFAINDHDQAAGYGEVLDQNGGCCDFFAVVWNDTTPTLLPGPPGYTGGVSEAHGINDRGWVVGFACVGRHCTAFLYDGATEYDLNTLLDSSGAGWRLTRAVAINKSGQIIGTGWLNGNRQAFLATPIQ